MKKKIIGILICTLLIATAVLPAVNSEEKNVSNQVSDEIYVDDDCGCGTNSVANRNSDDGHKMHFPQPLNTGRGKCITPPPGLISWWPLDSPDICEDIAGPYSGYVACGKPKPLAGKVDGACRFNHEGNQGAIRTFNKSDPFMDIGGGDFTIDAWIYPENLTILCQGLNGNCRDRIIIDNHPQYDRSDPIWIEPGITFLVRNEDWNPIVKQWDSMKLGIIMGPDSVFLTTGAPIVRNEWQHVAVTVSRTGGNLIGTFYLNGMPIDTFTPIAGDLYVTYRPDLGFPKLDIGHASPLSCGSCVDMNAYFNGLLDEIEIFNRALDANEIKDIYEADSYGKCKPKWIQRPNDCTAILIDTHEGINRIAADDFLCTTTGPITNITLWGSDPRQNGDLDDTDFTLSIYSDVPDPDGSDPLYSMPGTMLWSMDFVPGDYIIRDYSVCNPGWYYNAYEDWYFPTPYGVFQFDFYIDPCDAFIQKGTDQNPVVYWLAVEATRPVETFGGGFCWEASQDHWNDDAVYKGDSITSWLELRYPTGHPKVNESIDMAFKIVTDTGKIIKSPNPPIITGPTSGKAGTSYTYTFTSTDPDGDDVSYYIKWGDGGTTTWTAFQASGTSYSESHTWSTQDTYFIEAKAKDTYSAESDWATLEVSMPKSKPYTIPSFLQFLQNFLDDHPSIYQLFQRLFRP